MEYRVMTDVTPGELEWLLVRGWRRFDEHRQGLMRAELQRILDTPGLSRDVFEIASKSLA